MLNSLFSAFLMYSRIPVPQVEWKEDNRRYSLCFFPVIGVVIGIIQILLWILCSKYGIGRGLYAALAVAVPVMVTGGIHLDGYMDVHDAKGCMGDRERKLQVMKDSRIGAFAAIYLILYFILQFGMFYEVRTSEVIYVIAFAFVISRAMSGLAAVTFKGAKSDGTLQSFSKPAHRNITIAAEIIYIVLSMAVSVYINPAAGIMLSVGSVLTFIYYRIFSYKEFGGITGDLAGYFLQLCELVAMMCVVIWSRI